MQSYTFIPLSVWLLFAFTLSMSAQEDAEIIFSKAVDQLLTNQLELSMYIEATDNRGRITEKEYDILMARFGDTDKMRMVMQQPERAKGIKVVITQKPGETGIIEVFTPSNGKVRKMKATQENLDRFGSGFMLSEYASKAMDDMEFSLAGKEELEGSSCYVLEAGETLNPGGNRAKFLVEENTYHIRQIQVMNETGEVTSVTSLTDFRPVEGIRDKVYPNRIQTVNLIDQSVNRIQILQVVHRPGVTEDDFILEPAAEGS